MGAVTLPYFLYVFLKFDSNEPFCLPNIILVAIHATYLICIVFGYTHSVDHNYFHSVEIDAHLYAWLLGISLAKLLRWAICT